jgi:hypothetical protein
MGVAKFSATFVLKFYFVRVYLGKKGLFGAEIGGNPYSSARLSLFQCEDYLILI